jgi:RNA-directed DNA polymerase
MTWNMELLVAINMSKAEQSFRMEWKHDIPICLGIKSIQQWKDLPWKQLEKSVFKLQKRIYKASSRGDIKTVRKLQKTLMSSWSTKCLAVRRVTQDNTGRKTAGVDGIKSLSPEARLNLVGQLKLTGKSKPTRRVWIPKPSGEKRPLGIPTMSDRALQALVKLALEPEWEARFEPNSYGFRPGRSAHDAIEAIFKAIRLKPKYVLDADIAKCFDKINHKALLEKLNTFPRLRRQIKAWLKSGVIDSKELLPTSEGTPQGGVISPLLANIALHGMEEMLNEFAKTLDIRNPKGHQTSWKNKVSSLNIIRYADDFVILHEELSVIYTCRQIISEWLKSMGLELKPSKTKICHTLEEFEGDIGFNFLGFYVRQYKTGMFRSAKNAKGEPLGFKTLIMPSNESRQRHKENITVIIDTHKHSKQYELIKELNPIIIGWANYYSTVVSKEIFGKIDNDIYLKLRAWAKHRCPNSSAKEISNKYWHKAGEDNWSFSTTEGFKLKKHDETQIKNHVKVQNSRSPYDGDWVYWSSRMGKYPEVSTKMATLMERQKGKCNHCGLNFKYGDLIEIDHINPKSRGGKNNYGNLQALHRHCHDEKTANDGSLGILDQELSH